MWVLGSRSVADGIITAMTKYDGINHSLLTSRQIYHRALDGYIRDKIDFSSSNQEVRTSIVQGKDLGYGECDLVWLLPFN